MTSIHSHGPTDHPADERASATRPDHADRAFQLLRTVFTIAPIAFGLVKFANLLTNWENYLAPWINDLVPGTAHTAMLLVGVIEIVAGLAVAFRPKFGGLLVAALALALLAAGRTGSRSTGIHR